MISKDRVYEVIRPLCSSDQVAEALIEISMDEYRASEAGGLD